MSDQGVSVQASNEVARDKQELGALIPPITDLPGMLETIAAGQREQNRLLAEISENWNDVRTTLNQHTDALRWLTDNTQNLFSTIDQMNAAGGPAAMLGMMTGKGKQGG